MDRELNHLHYRLCVSSFFPPDVLLIAGNREGDRYLEDDDLLSSGQVSPLSM